MKPAQFTVQPGQRLMYASFAVPHVHVRGTFVRAKLAAVPGKHDLLGFEDGFTEKTAPAKE